MTAILGKKPIFDHKIQIVKPVLPGVDVLQSGIHQIIETGMVTKGKYLVSFEAAIADQLGVKHAVGVSSCTTGLMLVYQSLGLTGEVIVPSFTFMATVSAMIWCGLRPVFVDVKPETTNLDPEAIEAAITPQTTAIVAVHNFGNPAEISALEAISNRHGLKLIFDAAHGFGSLYRGKPVGKQGNAQVFSLSPTKLLIAGEGGIVATNDDALANNIRIGREYGNNGAYDTAFPGINARLAEFNALLGLKSLELLETAARRRNETAGLYMELLGRIPGLDFQKIHPDDRSSYKDFSITIDKNKFGLSRDETAAALAAENIDTRKYYDPPVHRQTAYTHWYSGQNLPATNFLAENSLSLPIYSDMDAVVGRGICQAIEMCYENAGDIRKRLSSGA